MSGYYSQDPDGIIRWKDGAQTAASRKTMASAYGEDDRAVPMNKVFYTGNNGGGTFRRASGEQQTHVSDIVYGAEKTAKNWRETMGHLNKDDIATGVKSAVPLQAAGETDVPPNVFLDPLSVVTHPLTKDPQTGEQVSILHPSEYVGALKDNIKTLTSDPSAPRRYLHDADETMKQGLKYSVEHPQATLAQAATELAGGAILSALV